MKLSPERIGELCERFSALHDGTIASEDAQRVERLVCEDQEVRRLYIRYMRVCAGLDWDYGTVPDIPVIGATGQLAASETLTQPAAGSAPVLPPMPNGPDNVPASPVLGFVKSTIEFVNRKWALSLLGTSLFVVATLTVMGILPMPGFDRRAVPPPAVVHTSTDAAVATLSRTERCRWADSEMQKARGSRLMPAEVLDLASGLAEIRFDSGARVVLEGPATFEIVADGEGFIRRGKLAAHVNSGAAGFQIRTERLRLIDLGTRFGVQVRDDSVTRAHVFAGSVNVAVVDGRGSSRSELTLGESEGVELVPDSETLTRIDADERAFDDAQDLLDQQPDEPVVARGYPAELPRSDLKLWLQAGVGITRDAGNSISRWADQSGYGNHAAPSDPSSRPVWVANRAAGHPVVRFDGIDDAIHNMNYGHGSDDVTLFLVARRNGEARGYHNLFIGGVPDRNTYTAFYQIYAESAGSQTKHLRLNCNHTGLDVNSTVPFSVTHFQILCLWKDHRGPGKSEFFINGASAGTGSGNLAAGDNYMIGSWGPNFTNGEIAEVLLYNAPLDTQARQLVEGNLAWKYRLESRLPRDHPYRSSEP